MTPILTSPTQVCPECKKTHCKHYESDFDRYCKENPKTDTIEATPEFRSFGKVHRLGKEEVEGILEGRCHIQEKVDGANTSIWLNEKGELRMASRTRILGDEEFNGFVPYVKAHEGINALLKNNPQYRLYGEWLVRHTIAYKETESKFEVMDVATPVSTCRFRDMERERKVGADVITNMALRYGLHPKPEKGYVLCDLDGTLADITHRLAYAKGETKNWGEFFARIPDDVLREDVAEIVSDFARQGYDIIFLSARPETYKKQTLVWLIKHMENRLPNGFLSIIMRRGNDKRPDVEVKQDLLNLHFPDRSLIKIVIDDRPSVIRMWRENGLPVMDVGKGVEF